MTNTNFVSNLKQIKHLPKKIMKIIHVARILQKKEQTILFFGTPCHSNMGDQAQTFTTIKWLEENYKGANICAFTILEMSRVLYQVMRKFIKPGDKIFFHSGYHLTDLYEEKSVYYKIMKLFPDFKITILPQTINYISKENEVEASKIFNSHPNVNLLCRDETSYKRAKKIFKRCNLYLYPDIVTSLIGTRKFNNQKDGILFCMRNDIEAYYKPEQIAGLRNRFIGIAKTEITDTTLDIPYKKIKNNREAIINSIFEEYSKYKLIITDRYHGTIFSLIAGTPVIVLSSTDHKLSSGVKWFPSLFSNYIKYAEDLEQAYQLALEMLRTNTRNEIPPYFKENYYDKLKERLGE